MLTDEQAAEAKRLWETTEQTAVVIGAIFGVSKNVIIGLADRRSWERPGQSKVMSERDKEIVALTKQGNTRRQVAVKLGLTKSIVQGAVYRNAPELIDLSRCRGAEPRTLFQRCDELHARMDAVLAECKDIPRIPAGRNQHAVTTWAMPRSLTRGMMADD